MSTASKIEWTETTWNPVTGCTKVSHGCKRCYAERMSSQASGHGHGEVPERVRRHGAP